MKSFRRHLLLWLGLIPGIFILWAWFDSTKYLTLADAEIRGRSVTLRHYKQRFGMEFMHEPSPMASWSFYRHPVVRVGGMPESPLFALRTTEIDPSIYGIVGKSTGFLIAHSVLFSAWLPLYASALLFHARAIRRRRDDEGAAEGAQGSS